MQAKRFLLAVVVAALLLCAVGWTGYAQRAKTKRTAWEYKVVSFSNQSVDRESLNTLNELGAQGWELVGVSEVGGIPTSFFKRPK
ncbi:MAG TPA: DUF4177 domain-containing protein [Pyrinomonadaceae bacterium]|jgi:hypothetical protein|nr:DUF4177 domain-containing protein [Pyrinomonadaceae bacterium]